MFDVAVVVTGIVYVKVVGLAVEPTKPIVVFAGTPIIVVPADKLKLNDILDPLVGENVGVILNVINKTPNGKIVPVVNKSVNVFAGTDRSNDFAR